MSRFISCHYSELVSTLAIILSLGQLIVSARKKRTQLIIHIEDVQQYVTTKDNYITVLFTFINKSDAPINITRLILIASNGMRIESRLRAFYIGEHYYPKNPETDIPCTERVFSERFPISLLPHGAQSGHIVFDTAFDFAEYKDGDEMMFNVITEKKTITYKGQCVIHQSQMRYL